MLQQQSDGPHSVVLGSVVQRGLLVLGGSGPYVSLEGEGGWGWGGIST